MIEKIVKDIDDIVILLYRQRSDEGFKSIELLLINLENYLNELYQSYDENHLKLAVENLNIVLNQLLMAIEDKDYIVIADTLKYELVSCLINMDLQVLGS